MKRAYYITDISGIEEFPVYEEWVSDAFPSRRETDIALEAERGKKFVYKQGSRRVWKPYFKAITEAELAFFETLHVAVGGQETPFYFVFDVDASPGDSVLVRKEAHFEPVCVFAGLVDGAFTRLYDYTLILTEEIDTEFEIDA